MSVRNKRKDVEVNRDKQYFTCLFFSLLFTKAIAAKFAAISSLPWTMNKKKVRNWTLKSIVTKWVYLVINRVHIMSVCSDKQSIYHVLLCGNYLPSWNVLITKEIAVIFAVLRKQHTLLWQGIYWGIRWKYYVISVNLCVGFVKWRAG